MDETKLSQALNQLMQEPESTSSDSSNSSSRIGPSSTCSTSEAGDSKLERPTAKTMSAQNRQVESLRVDGTCPFDNMSLISPAFTPRATSPGIEVAPGLKKLDLDHKEPKRSEVSVENRVPTETRHLNHKATDLDSTTAISGGRAQFEPQVPHTHHEESDRHESLVAKSLVDQLPTVFCESRARIPTTSGTEIFLHLYRNNVDTKEHLAIVFGEHIHSKTLFAPREGETEQDRMTRGAYIGKLWPGRQKSDSSQAYPETETQPVPSRGREEESSETRNQPEITNQLPDTLVRIHSECYTGETAWSARCDCGEQLDEAARLMAAEQRGVIVYLRQEGRGIGLAEKLKAYNLQDLGADTVQANLMLRHPADARSFSLATAILLDLGQPHIRLLTNNPDKIRAVEGKHKEVTVTQRVPMVPLSWQNKQGVSGEDLTRYLKTKRERMGHMLPEEMVEVAVAALAQANGNASPETRVA